MSETAPHILFRDDLAGKTLRFSAPSELVVARRVEEVLPALERLEAHRRAGKWLAGYLAYEAGFAFEDKLLPLAPTDRETPLICMGVFDAPGAESVATSGMSAVRLASSPRLRGEGPERQRGDEGQSLPPEFEALAPHPPAGTFSPQAGRRTGAVPPADPIHDVRLHDARAAWDEKTYADRFAVLHEHLRRGDCFQGNLTMPIEARYAGNAESLFRSLIARQPVRYGALVELGGPAIASRSPELFFAVDEEGFIETHPMKGTAARGADDAEDEVIRAAMLSDDKTLAENRMIVDLLRNDISRISETGTLSVPKLFDIETYPTVHQMVSHVRAKLLPDVGLPDIMRALFPCGSITGAPKLSAMTILHRLEAQPRDVYCGAIGWCDPSGPMRFSVAIRTISLFSDGRAVFNVGGGIVYDSLPGAEYQECLLKARFAVGDEWISR